eukprot:1967022-Prymnesium_polylepis.1
MRRSTRTTYWERRAQRTAAVGVEAHMYPLVPTHCASSRCATQFKHAIEHKYDRLLTPRLSREARWRGVLERVENIDDALERESVLWHHRRLETANLRAKRRPLRLDDFEVLDVVGRGASGEVCVCRQLNSGAVYAMKKLSKAALVKR